MKTVLGPTTWGILRSTILSSLSMNRCPSKRGHVHPVTAMPVCARRRTRPTWLRVLVC